MKYLNTYAQLGAALVIAAAGIGGLIDETTMIILTIFVVCCMPNGREPCRGTREA